MGLFLNNKKAELEKVKNELFRIGKESLMEFNMELDEKINLIEQIEESFNENFDNPNDAKKKLVRITCDEIATKYPDFSIQATAIKNSLLTEIDQVEFIHVRSIDDLMLDINWKYNITPDDAQQILKNTRAEGDSFSKEEYKKIMDKIAEKYEPELLIEIDSILPENIELWIDNTKGEGKSISNKVYAKAMAKKKGETWLPDDQYSK